MITLTFDHRAPDPIDNPKYYTLAWDKFVKRLRRKFPSIKFARIVELHQSGRPHFHVLINQYISQKYVSWAFKDCGGGYVADVRYIDPGRAVKYVTKYLHKSFEDDHTAAEFFFLSRMRSVSTSRDLYYVIPTGDTVHRMNFLEQQQAHTYLRYMAIADGIVCPRLLIDVPEHPTFVWDIDPNWLGDLPDPQLEFPFTYDHLRAWTLDLDGIPTDEQMYLHFPPGLTLESVTELQQKNTV